MVAGELPNQSEMQNSISILCTRPLEERLVEEARINSIDIDIIPFIETEPIESVEVQQEIEYVLSLQTTVVFTSMNAVEAVAANMIEEQPAWKIYCIGFTTTALIRKLFPFSEIVATADNAADLAALIVEGQISDEVVFFCGDQRREELPQILRKHHITVNEIIVYQTIALPQKVKKNYLGILFFSPSAVDSFFEMNKVADHTVFFAIGNTTASCIRKYSANRIQVANQPGKENLVQEMIGYFT